MSEVNLYSNPSCQGHRLEEKDRGSICPCIMGYLCSRDLESTTQYAAGQD